MDADDDKAPKPSGFLRRLGPRFGDIARALGLVSSGDIHEAVRHQREEKDPAGRRERIGAVLAAQGKLSEEDVQEVLKGQEEVAKAKLTLPEDVRGFLEEQRKRLQAARQPKAEDLERRLAEVERKLMTREQAEGIAAGAALDVLKLHEGEMREAVKAIREAAAALEKHEFARRVAESLRTRACRAEIEELVGDTVHYESEEAFEAMARKVFSSQLQTPEFARKLREIAGAAREVDTASKRLATRLDEIEREALPRRVEELFDEKLEEKLGDVSAEAIVAKLDGQVLEQVLLGLARGAVNDFLESSEFRSMLDESLLQATMRDVINTPEFKAVLDERFKAISDFLSEDVVPRQVRRLKEGEAPPGKPKGGGRPKSSA